MEMDQRSQWIKSKHTTLEEVGKGNRREQGRVVVGTARWQQVEVAIVVHRRWRVVVEPEIASSSRVSW
jgi:hypothetical protein